MRYMITLTLCALLCVAPVPLQADDAGAAMELIRTTVDAVMVQLKDKSLDKQERNKRIIDIVTPVFDYQTMAKLSLGKKYWPTLDEEKRQEFSDLFVVRLQKSYLDKLDLYNDEKIQYGEPKSEGKTIHVPTTMVTKDSRIEMLYKLYRSAAGWKVYDVEAGGVSVIQTYRSQFDGILSQGGIDDLLARLGEDGALDIPEPATDGARQQ